MKRTKTNSYEELKSACKNVWLIVRQISNQFDSLAAVLRNSRDFGVVDCHRKEINIGITKRNCVNEGEKEVSGGFFFYQSRFTSYLRGCWRIGLCIVFHYFSDDKIISGKE